MGYVQAEWQCSFRVHGKEPAGPLNARMMEFFFCSGDITCTLEALPFPIFSKGNLFDVLLGGYAYQ